MVVLKNENEFESLVLKNKKPVLVDFYADWCGPCQALLPTLEELSKEYDGKLDIVKVDVDANRDIASKYEIRGIPALFFFKDGEVKNLLSGLQPKENLVSEINKLV